MTRRTHTFRPLTTGATALALAAALGLGLALPASAADIDPAAVDSVLIGQRMSDVHAAFGEPLEHNTYLFAPGSRDFYYIRGGSLGGEWVLRIDYDAEGRVINRQRINAEYVGHNRFD